MMSICPIVHILLLLVHVTSFLFYQKQNVRAFVVILDMTMKAVSLET